MEQPNEKLSIDSENDEWGLDYSRLYNDDIAYHKPCSASIWKIKEKCWKCGKKNPYQDFFELEKSLNPKPFRFKAYGSTITFTGLGKNG